MERCRSSEAVLGTPEGRRVPKGTSLLFNEVSSGDEIEVAEGDPQEKGDQVHVESAEASDEKMDVDEVVEVVYEEKSVVWGMPRWGWEEERKEVRKGVRLVGMEEVSAFCSVGHKADDGRQLPGLIGQQAMIDTPSHVLFPWLHGISDDGSKGRDMAAFFG